jgi:hypothetical protein
MHKRTLCARSFVVLALLLLSGSGLSLAAAETGVVINEVMYHAPFDLDDLQYIELHNCGSAEVDLTGWSLAKGVKFTFPEQTRLSAGGFLVVCRKANVLQANYGGKIPVAGEFTGKLSHRGEGIELRNASGKVIDAMRYEDQAPWPAGPDGHSASLERICPFVSGQEPANWAGSKLPEYEKPAGTPGQKNESFCTNLPPVISQIRCSDPKPGTPVTISAKVADVRGVNEVVLMWRVCRTGQESEEKSLAMQRLSGDPLTGTYQASIEPQPAGKLVRWRIRAVNRAGNVRLAPAATEPRPAYSFSTFVNTNAARIPFAYVFNILPQQGRSQTKVWNGRNYELRANPTRGNGAFLYAEPGSNQVVTYDYVRIRPRKGGFKAHFLKDQTFKGMTGINVIFEGSPRYALSEPLAFELYRLAGVPACLTEHVRTWVDGQPRGYQLLIEQPNKAFLSRNQRDNDGYLYKVVYWQQGLVQQHLKRTREATTSDDLVALHRGLTSRSGTAQWEFIRQNLNVDEFAGYYAVNMCIQNWDGFFNNYYLYHDAAGTGKWEMYPWDEDKTWGDYDGASASYDWYSMPLTFGMNEGELSGHMGWGAGGWWRPPGWFSGPLLANRDFRLAFLNRLRALCTDVFTEEKLIPIIDALQQRLEPEISRNDLGQFRREIQSLRNQVKYRRKFILEAIPKDRTWR